MRKSKGLLAGFILSLTMLGAMTSYAALPDDVWITWDFDGTIRANNNDNISDFSMTKNADGSWNLVMVEGTTAYLGYTSNYPESYNDWSISPSTGAQFLEEPVRIGSGLNETEKNMIVISTHRGSGGWSATEILYPTTVVKVGDPRELDWEYRERQRGNAVTIHVKVVYPKKGMFCGIIGLEYPSIASGVANATEQNFNLGMSRESFITEWNLASMYTMWGKPTGWGPATYSDELEKLAQKRALELLKDYTHPEAGRGNEYFEHSWFANGEKDHPWDFGSITPDGYYFMSLEMLHPVGRDWNKPGCVLHKKPITEVGAARLLLDNSNISFHVLITR